mmetsp:Transcript_1267/g.3030  ORF Transcript_1267/g.3030 Transcript_1267/m.3030 type:complete len:302 (-) Transcript_1267:54-959(-)
MKLFYLLVVLILQTLELSFDAYAVQCGCLDVTEGTCVHVLLATPCYSSTVAETYLLSVSRSFQYFACSKFQLHLATVPGIADLPKARGALIHQFLANEHYHYVFFVDADVEWAPSMIERFILSGHDVVAAMYPKKQLDWHRLRDAARSAELSTEELRSAALDYPVEFEFEDGRTQSRGEVKTDGNGMARVKRAGAAFMMVSREAMLRLRQAYPSLAYVDPPSGQTHYGLFHTGFEGGDGDRRWVSEDFSFCDRWRAVGGEVWVDLTTGLNHTGSFRFEGAHWVLRFQEKPPQRDKATDKEL